MLSYRLELNGKSFEYHGDLENLDHAWRLFRDVVPDADPDRISGNLKQLSVGRRRRSGPKLTGKPRAAYDALLASAALVRFNQGGWTLPGQEEDLAPAFLASGPTVHALVRRNLAHFGDYEMTITGVMKPMSVRPGAAPQSQAEAQTEK